jgi:hypothetical protein
MIFIWLRGTFIGPVFSDWWVARQGPAPALGTGSDAALRPPVLGQSGPAQIEISCKSSPSAHRKASVVFVPEYNERFLLTR